MQDGNVLNIWMGEEAKWASLKLCWYCADEELNILFRAVGMYV